MQREKLTVTIDGPAGAGKSTLAKALADELGYTYLDSGALYRAVALAALRAGLGQSDQAGLSSLMGRIEIELKPSPGGVMVFLDGRDVSSDIRTEEVGNAASAISKLAPVREKLTALQRRLGAWGGVVLEGRDAGSVVFPQAEVKFFLTASLEERAGRRVRQLAEKGITADPEQVRAEMAARDDQDRSREIAPLKPPAGAEIIDSTGVGFQAVLDAAVDKVRNRLESGQ